VLGETVVDGVVRVGACELAYSVAGAGRDVVLVHGLGGSRVLWGPLVEELARDARVVSYDLRGAGRTREERREELTLERWAADLRGLAEALALERPVLVGHSLGGSIALRYALTWPDDVAGLVLIGADANLARIGDRMRRSIDAIEREGLEAWVAGPWSQNPPFAAAAVERAPDGLALYRAMLLANDQADYVRTCAAIAACEDLSGRLGEIAAPAVVLAGLADDRTPPAHAAELAARLPRAELVELPEVGHSVPLEAPADVAAAARRLLRGEAA
jgi:3-oxoadipate enol-lactonase